MDDWAIRLAGPDDAPRISALLSELSARFISPRLSPEGRHRVAISMTADAVAGYMGEGLEYHVAETKDSALLGVVATRDDSHLFHLFVAEDCQGHGLARALWQHVKVRAQARSSTKTFTVNASLNAVDIYLRLGFRRSGLRACAGGVDYQPMRTSDA